jgi:hypothetical protein
VIAIFPHTFASPARISSLGTPHTSLYGIVASLSIIKHHKISLFIKSSPPSPNPLSGGRFFGKSSQVMI